MNVLSTVGPIGNFPYHNGKVRESYSLPNGKRAIVVTDRVSAFDVVFGCVPCKGQVLNQLAAWWFRKMEGVVPHHFIDMPHANISIVKEAKPLPIEIIVRGYLTGSTTTSSWHHYNHNHRIICGIEMPEGMQKNQPFERPIVTPTTKPTVGHDRPISREEILSEGLVDEKLYNQVEEYALKLFAFGQKVAAERGLILVDTKYEMGLDSDGNLMLIDEVHTPDSSRYWMADSYAERFAKGEEPDMLDKEFFRRMLINEAGFVPSDYPDPDLVDPKKYMTDDLSLRASQKYQELYRVMTGEVFVEQRVDDVEAVVRRLGV